MLSEKKSPLSEGILHVDDVPVAHTPTGGYGKTFPKPILHGCTDPLVAGAPDLRGLWQVTEAEAKGKPLPKTHKLYRHYQRIEQCADRIIVTGGGVIHDMRCDGTVEHGVHDVSEMDFKTKLTVVATYENGVHVLRPQGFLVRMMSLVLRFNPIVTRRRDGDDMIWEYTTFTARLRKIGGPEDSPYSNPN